MARSRNTNRNRKSRQEARVERFTWFAMVVIFILISLDERLTYPGYWVPIAISAILFISGFIQYQNGWRISPLTWIVGAVLLVVGGLTWYFAQPEIGVSIQFFDPILISLIATVVVIVYGIISNES
ncbi:hypothetical protein G4Y79_13535 [Phototrophicus methaneseepsis]|uniref:Uncharacterized protein n=1 Tax=Phototrophicus methaneseepsis TaxID=2710758 RepID=A0A7S8E5M3_9CHLR|nr:hypothetical protein [Phototrophicus methaneseepsis]QPC80734.1 hypothetical protein G4Y79_13535 [Phototrophicus methaneseepsis]